ncbi:uncharacterized protein At2g39795, mitochondrial-like [Tasmannia lanceolata]|uniref:uncharacterized protein At2g39795, mitochondrial-like n=1 Tax=Tasmannia lanceolata TaxID=3420 RepID=UPI0040630C4E
MAFYPLHLRSFKTLQTPQTPQTINPTFSAPKPLSLKTQNLSLKMAFYPLHLRRMASSVVAPLAIRAMGVRRDYHCTLFSPLQNILSHKVYKKTTVSPPHFPLLVANHSSDAKLSHPIDLEIESDDYVKVAEIPDGFPFEIQDEAEIPEWFKVSDEDFPGHPIFFKREYEGETILVKVRIPDDLVTDDIKGGQYSLRLIIYICEGYMPNLVLLCTGCREEISFDGMMFVPVKQISDDEAVYEGPDFKVPGVFEKYLEIRGIKPSTIIYLLHEYMIKRAKST